MGLVMCHAPRFHLIISLVGPKGVTRTLVGGSAIEFEAIPLGAVADTFLPLHKGRVSLIRGSVEEVAVGFNDAVYLVLSDALSLMLAAER